MAKAQPVDTFRPSSIQFQVLKNKVYLLTWHQHGTSRQKLLTRNTSFRFANDLTVSKELRDAVTDAFVRGEIV
jgi:hypothetical protein